MQTAMVDGVAMAAEKELGISSAMCSVCFFFLGVLLLEDFFFLFNSIIQLLYLFILLVGCCFVYKGGR